MSIAVSADQKTFYLSGGNTSYVLHIDDDGRLVKLVADEGAKGIVYAGMGNGSIPARVEAELGAAARIFSVDVFETEKNRATYYPDF